MSRKVESRKVDLVKARQAGRDLQARDRALSGVEPDDPGVSKHKPKKIQKFFADMQRRMEDGEVHRRRWTGRSLFE
jgi:hypothetical protein